MHYREADIRVLDAPRDYYRIQYISADALPGNHLNEQFDKKHNLKPLGRLAERGYIHEGMCLELDNVYNIVISKLHWEKPTYHTFKRSIQNMRLLAIEQNTKKIAIPKLDTKDLGLEWIRADSMIQDVFRDTDIEILICTKP